MIKLITVFIPFSILILTVELIRREKLTFKYGFVWIVVSMIAMFFSVFDSLLFRFSDFLGFELPSNFIFFALLSVFVFISLLMTIFLCQQNNRNDLMAQKIGILDAEIRELRKKMKQ